MKSFFVENQRFNQWWVWAILLLACGVPFVVFYRQIILGENVGEMPVSDSLIIVTTLFCLMILLFFLLLRLKTEINPQYLSYQFYPFPKRSFPFEEIEIIKVIKYGFVGGWGIRYTMKYGTVFNIRGNKGLYVRLKNGKTFVIGTQNPEELEKVVEKLKKR